MRYIWRWVLGFGVVCGIAVACRDLTAPVRRARPLAASVNKAVIPYEFVCTARRKTRRVQCAPLPSKRIARSAHFGQHHMSAHSGRISRDIVIGGSQGQYITIGFGNVAFDSITNIFSLDATVQNNLAEPMGTPDGLTLTGVKVFFFSGPTCSGGACYVANADGTSHFTADSQPYFTYNQILEPQQVSSSRNWQFYLAPSVQSFNFEIEVYAAFPAENNVTMSPPDTLPINYYADTNITSDSSSAARFLRNVVVVDFTDTAQLVDRQLVIAKVGGVIVGGTQIYSNGDGTYFLAVPSDAAGDGALMAVDTLLSYPAVQNAGVELTAPNTPAYLRPQDDSASGWRSWQLNPDSATGNNWGPEAVAAPLAWGCSTGDTSFTIGIADHNWHNVGDVQSNVVSTEAMNVFTDTTHDSFHHHGMMVNSILAARGGNDTGVAGMVWYGKVARTETALRNSHGQPVLDSLGRPKWSTNSVINAIDRAARTGAAIVNSSNGFEWREFHVMTAGDNGFAADAGRQLATRLRGLASGPHFAPLVVLASGNDSIAAAANGYPQAATDPMLRSRIIVVAASYRSSNHAETWSDFSNMDSLVTVAAPGVNVSGLDEFGNVITGQNGTSYATALVSGLAAQLLSFDHTLTAAQLKTLIVNGATNGGRTFATVPIVNAYESLKLAAQSSGKALCGNRVWSTNGAIYAQRASTNDLLFTGNGPAWNVIPMHGGHRVEYTTDSGRYSVRFTGTSWGTPVQVQDANTAVSVSPGYSDNPNAQASGGTPVSNADTTASDSILAGASRSIWGLNHDGDSAVGAIINTHADSGTSTHMDTVVVIRGPTQVMFGLASGSVDTVGRIIYASPTFSLGACRVESGPPPVCSPTVVQAGNNMVQLAYAPRGDRILVAINHQVYSEAVTSNQWVYDTNATTGRYVGYLPFMSYLVTGTVEAWQFSLPSKSPSQISSSLLPSGKDIWWWGISEADSTIVVATGARRYWLSLDNTGTYTAADSGTGCAVEYRNGSFGTPALFTQSTSDACVTRIGAQGLQVVYGSGGISPQRVLAAPGKSGVRAARVHVLPAPQSKRTQRSH